MLNIIINNDLATAVGTMSSAIQNILGGNSCSIYIFGSVALDDFQLGWSDIDILCLTEQPINDVAANSLVGLRQVLLSNEPSNPYYRSFEGAVVHADDFLNSNSCKAVYWGTSSERVEDNYILDSFSKKELSDSAILICGEDIKTKMTVPSYRDLFDGVVSHYETIRKYAVSVPRRIKSYGWMLDIARCIYTLRTGEIIAKTAAAQWALDNGICPVPDALQRALLLRKNPLIYQNDSELLDYTAALGEDIQRFADVLEIEIKKASGRDV